MRPSCLRPEAAYALLAISVRTASSFSCPHAKNSCLRSISPETAPIVRAAKLLQRAAAWCTTGYYHPIVSSLLLSRFSMDRNPFEPRAVFFNLQPLRRRPFVFCRCIVAVTRLCTSKRHNYSHFIHLRKNFRRIPASMNGRFQLLIRCIWERIRELTPILR